MRHVLIVTSSYYPAVLADTHRARLLAPELKSYGWEVEVLTAGIEFQRADAIEKDAAPFFDSSVVAHFALPRGQTLFRIFNIRSVGWRAFWPLYLEGARLLAQRRFDLVYITTTQFNLFCLGRLWRRRFGVPYVLDFHDPWVRRTRGIVSTKHKLKFRITIFLARALEKYAIRKASGVVSVSRAYLRQLRLRYRGMECLKDDRTAVIPFSGNERDLTVVPPTIAENAKIEVAYVGAGGEIMEKSWRMILAVLVSLKPLQSKLVDEIRFKFFGTEAFWREGERKFLVEIAREYGLAHLVEEHPRRISYRRATEIIQSSAGLIVLGVDDPGYMPSKLFAYSLTDKPLLVCLHKHSDANRYFRDTPGIGRLMHFGKQPPGKDREDRECTLQFLIEAQQRRSFDRRSLLQPYLAPAAAAAHAALFDHCVTD